VELLIGDPTKAQNILGWKHKYELPELVSEMVRADVELFSRDKYLLEGGHKVMNYHE
jgi:GDPmannose 4,6-dehydratase